MIIALHPEDIKAVLRKAHGSVAAFERHNNLPEKSVSDLLRGRTNFRVEKAVTAELTKAGVSESEVSDDSARRKRSHRLNAEAR